MKKKQFIKKQIRTIFLLLIMITLTTFNICAGDVVKVFVMAGQSNMEGNNTPQARLEELIRFSNSNNYAIPASELSDLFLDTMLADYNEAIYSHPGNPVVKKMELFLYKTGSLSIPPGENLDLNFDFTDRVFKTISEYYYNGSSYAYGYDAFKQMSSAMGVNLINSDGYLTGSLITGRDDVTVLQYQGSLNADGTRTFRERYGNLRNQFGNNSTSYGPELIFGNYLGDLTEDDVLLLKVVQGGTDLRVAWRSPGVEANSGNNYTAEELNQQSLYGYMLNYINNIQDSAVLTSYFPQYSGKRAEIAGFVWFQGWNDGNKEVNRTQYQYNFFAFLNDLRADLRMPELPVTVIQSHVGEPDNPVQVAQANVVGMIDHAELAVSDDLSGYYHFDNAAHLVIGRRAYLAMSQLLPTAATATPASTPTPSPTPTPAPATPIPTPTPNNGYSNFSQCDIGPVNLPGSASCSEGRFTIAGSGADIYNKADEFHFVYWNLKGDGTISARVTSLTNTGPWAKAGVMIRDSLEPQSPESAVVVSAECGIAYQWRLESGERTYWRGSTGNVPYWLKLERLGDVFTAYKSSDGVAWEQIGQNSIIMGADVYAGLCVCAVNADGLNTATIDNLTIIDAEEVWDEGPGSDENSGPVVYLPQRYASEDISGYDSLVDIKDTSTTGDFYIYPEFNKKQITVTFSQDVFITSPHISISFKVQPDAPGGENTIISAENFFTVREETSGALTSVFYDNHAPVTILTNTGSTIKYRSGNHFAAVLGRDFHKSYFNGKPAAMEFAPDYLSGNKTFSFTIGPYPGKIWDIKIYNRQLTETEIMEEAGYFTDDVYKPDIAPDPAYPNGLCGVYRTEWWPLEENLEEGEAVIPLETYEYYLFAQERATKYFYFKAGMLPAGREDEFIGLEPDTDLILGYGIRRNFVRAFSFDKPQNAVNSNHWLHENFHSYQGALGNFLGFSKGKWFAEATASWGPHIVFPGSQDTLMAYYTLAPHMPLWITQNGAVDDLAGWEYKGGHQYGSGIFLWYLTTYVTTPDLIGRIYNDTASTAAALFNQLGTDPETGDPVMRKALGDFAARTITWDYDVGDLLADAEAAGLKRIMGAGDLTVEQADNRFPAIYGAAGTGNSWVSVPDDHTPGSWGYNAYKCESVNSGTYTIEFQTDSGNPAESFYELRVVVHNENTGQRTYYSLHNVTNGQTARINNIITDQDDILYFIAAATPDILSGDNERYPYQYKIYPNIAPAAD